MVLHRPVECTAQIGEVRPGTQVTGKPTHLELTRLLDTGSTGHNRCRLLWRGFAMRQRLLFSLLVVAALGLRAMPQNVGSTEQETLRPKTESPKWTEADEKRFLSKAQSGDADAQMWLGAAYEQGWFGNTNLLEALKWFRKSAEQGNPDAQNSLGQMYEYGEGVAQNFSFAAEWYRKAAEHVPDLGGAGQGRNNLGMLYLDGHGVPKDYVQAYMWFKLSDFESNPNLSNAKAHMTPEQILEAERLVAAWKTQHVRSE